MKNKQEVLKNKNIQLKEENKVIQSDLDDKLTILSLNKKEFEKLLNSNKAEVNKLTNEVILIIVIV